MENVDIQMDLSEADEIYVTNISSDIDEHEYPLEEEVPLEASPNPFFQENDNDFDDSELMEDAPLLSDFSDLELKDYAESKNIEKDVFTPFTLVHTNTGQEIVVRKSSICWLLNESVGKLSSDRMQRVDLASPTYFWLRIIKIIILPCINALRTPVYAWNSHPPPIWG